jgi:CHAD domain-containing protein
MSMRALLHKHVSPPVGIVCAESDRMSFAISEAQHIEDELRKIVRRQLRKTSRTLDGEGGSNLRTAVHQSRRSLKKVRAVAGCLKDAGAKLPRKDRKQLKSAARALSRLRDSAAIIDTFDRVRRRYPKALPEHTYALLRRGLVADRDRQEARARREGVIANVVQRLERTRPSVKKWGSPSIDLADMTGIVGASYRRSRRTMEHARTTGQSATVHRWRKDLKTLWYQLRLVAPLATGVQSLVGEIKQLETELGDDHNLVVLAATLRGCRDLRSLGTDIRRVDQSAARMRRRLRKRAFALGGRLHVRTPEKFTRWLRSASKQARRQAA